MFVICSNVFALLSRITSRHFVMSLRNLLIRIDLFDPVEYWVNLNFIPRVGRYIHIPLPHALPASTTSHTPKPLIVASINMTSLNLLSLCVQ